MALYLGEDKVSVKSISSNYAEGYEEGKTEGYDSFWDTFQKNGKRDSYESAFAYGWTDETFKPKYDLRLTYATRLFQYTGIVDLAGILATQGVVLDTSGCTALLQMFQGAEITHIPALDLSKSTNNNYAFGSYCKVQTIDKLIVTEITQFSTSTFGDAKNLRNITFEGSIGMSIYFQHSPLTAASINSVITHLSDTVTGRTATFKLSAVNTAFETEEGLADGSSSQVWLDLMATKSNWNISLI